MRRYSWTGEALIGCGVLHTLVGVLLGWPALREIASRRVINSAYQVDFHTLPHYGYPDWVTGFVRDGGDVPRVVWFLWSGFPWMMLGYWARRLERGTGESMPEWLGWSLLVYAGAALLLLPVSGFWLVASVAVYAIVIARSAETRRIA
jgi:hypothetical protein